MGDGRVHPLAKTLRSLVSHLRWNIVMDDWNLDEIPPPPKKKVQGMINNVGLIFSVGDTTPRVTLNIEQDN